MNIFELTFPRTEHPPKKINPPSLPSLSLRPSIHRFNISIENASKTHPRKKKTKINGRQESCDEIKFIHISFYDERETNDRSLILNLKKKKKKIWKRKISIEKMIFLRVRLVYMLYIYTYIHTYLVPTYYTYMRSFCPSSLQKRKTLSSCFVFCPNEKSERKRKVRAKKVRAKKKENKREEILFTSYLPTKGR